MMRTDEGRRRSAPRLAGADVGVWSTPELRAELAQTLCDLRAAHSLEVAMRARHARQRTPEVESAYDGRKRQTAMVRRRYALLLEELERRSETPPSG